ncbi:uncharacterized protein [Dermacentor andersoni]|uniref:uncharacterized protein isoform X2 n=1 Tax=Dermacentor andersoni TaxID=34620 RepID=UPI003B3A36C4
MTTHYPSRMRFNERLQLDCLGHINMVNYIRKHNLDLSMCRMEDSDFAGDFELDLQPGTQQVTALAGYFDCTFELPVPARKWYEGDWSVDGKAAESSWSR